MDEVRTLTVSVEEACKILGISRSLGYRLIDQNKFPGVLKLGHRIKISVRALERTLLEGFDTTNITEET